MTKATLKERAATAAMWSFLALYGLALIAAAAIGALIVTSIAKVIVETCLRNIWGVDL